jgi:hypothetical protein
MDSLKKIEKNLKTILMKNMVRILEESRLRLRLQREISGIMLIVLLYTEQPFLSMNLIKASNMKHYQINKKKF